MDAKGVLGYLKLTDKRKGSHDYDLTEAIGEQDSRPVRLPSAFLSCYASDRSFNHIKNDAIL